MPGECFWSRDTFDPYASIADADSRTKKGLELFFDCVQINFPSKLSLDISMTVNQISQWEAEHSSV